MRSIGARLRLVSAAGNPLISLLREVGTAEWVANVGLPLLVAVVSLIIAARLISKQLGQDRELARAGWRAQVARQLGSELRAVVRELESKNMSDLWWSQPEWDGWRRILETVDNASVVLGPLEQIVDVAREILYRWRIAQTSRKKESPEAGDHGSILFGLLEELANRLQGTAVTLIAWDGLGDVPLPLATDGKNMPSPSGDRERHRAWTSQVTDEYEKQLSAKRARQR